jgi:CheY-like chemotaxis protein
VKCGEDIEDIKCASGKSEAQNEHKGGEFAGRRLLLAEDVEVNREVLIMLLAKTDIIIDIAENGQEALDMVEAAPDKYDLIFMDMQMPIMGGLEATQRIRALPAIQGRKLPIVAITANVFKDDVDECIASGMDDHLGKPLNVDELFKKLRKYLV